MSAALSAGRLARAAFWLLFALQPLWHLLLHPAQRLPPWLVTLLFAAPLLPPAIGLLRDRPGALFWGGVVSLLHFCFGVSEAWADPAVRGIALIQTALAAVLIVAIGVDGLNRRRAARAGH